MEIASFDDLLRAAAQEPEPQRLLFVFAASELPPDSTPEERARFEAGQGGALTPVMCVDKSPDDIQTFAALVEESLQFGQDWKIVFVASLPGKEGRAPTSEDAEAPLQRAVESIRAGTFRAFLPFDRNGVPIMIE